MKKTTLCFCLKDDSVLLAMKKRGFGAGKWNGYGGKLQSGEGPKSATLRELTEESGLVAKEEDLNQVALVYFYFAGNPVFECFVYLLDTWENTPVETEEMCPQWYKVSNLPFDAMWVADAQWLPLILQGEKIEVLVNFNSDGTVVENISYRPLKLI